MREGALQFSHYGPFQKPMDEDVVTLLWGAGFGVIFIGIVCLAMYLGNRAQRRREQNAPPDWLSFVDDVISCLPENKPGDRATEVRMEYRTSSTRDDSSTGGGGDFGGGGASGDY